MRDAWVGRDTAAEQIPQEGLAKVVANIAGKAAKDMASRLDLPAWGTQPGPDTRPE